MRMPFSFILSASNPERTNPMPRGLQHAPRKSPEGIAPHFPTVSISPLALVLLEIIQDDPNAIHSLSWKGGDRSVTD